MGGYAEEEFSARSCRSDPAVRTKHFSSSNLHAFQGWGSGHAQRQDRNRYAFRHGIRLHGPGGTPGVTSGHLPDVDSACGKGKSGGCFLRCFLNTAGISGQDQGAPQDEDGDGDGDGDGALHRGPPLGGASGQRHRPLETPTRYPPRRGAGCQAPAKWLLSASGHRENVRRGHDRSILRGGAGSTFASRWSRHGPCGVRG